MPGIFSARWAEDATGNRDFDARDGAGVGEARSGRPDDVSHDAHFACALAIAWPNDGQAETFEGRVDGTLVWPPRGDQGFGYDPMFVPARPSRRSARWTRRKAPHQPPRGRLRQAVAGAQGMSGEPLALYVHWPFCVSKCPYCDFNSHVRAEIDQDAWRDALLADLAHEARLLPGRRWPRSSSAAARRR